MRVRDSLVLIAGAVLLALLVKTFVVDVVFIPSHSMERTLLPGDYVIVNKLVYGRSLAPGRALSSVLRLPGLRAIARGDVIVFNFPGPASAEGVETGSCFVKRCIGLPGDLVSVEDGTLTINGMALPDYHVSPSDGAFGGISSPVFIPQAGDTLQLRLGEYAYWHTILAQEGHSADTVEGTAFVDGARTTSYVVRDNYFFVVGDNAGKSYDSRAWGLLGSRSVLGKAELVYWSRRDASPDGPQGIRWERIGHFIR